MMRAVPFPAPTTNRLAMISVMATLAVSVAFPGRVQGKFYSYDLDSLVFLADHIVEGEITACDPKGHSASVKLTAIHAGALTAGRTIVLPGIGNYNKPAKYPAIMESLGSGDKLFLFLKEWPASGENEKSFGAVGLKWVAGNAVCGFQLAWHNHFMALYCAENPAGAHLVALPTSEEFREEIKEAMGRAATWHAEFKDAPQPKDIPRLVSILESRRKASSGNRLDDEIKLIASERLASLHDLRSIEKTLLIGNGEPRVLERGFGTPQGREYLLAKVAAPGQTPRSTMELAQHIAHAGGVYRSTMTYDGARFSHHVSVEGDADRKNSLYLTRIAKLAISESLDEDASEELLRALEDLAGPGDRDPEVQADLDSAAELLRPMGAKESTPVRTRRQIEAVLRAVSNRQPAFRRLPDDDDQ